MRILVTGGCIGGYERIYKEVDSGTNKGAM